MESALTRSSTQNNSLKKRAPKWRLTRKDPQEMPSFPSARKSNDTMRRRKKYLICGSRDGFGALPMRYARRQTALRSVAKRSRLLLHLHRENPRDRFADVRAMDAVQRQRELRFHQAVRNPRVVALALRVHDPVFLRRL